MKLYIKEREPSYDGCSAGVVLAHGEHNGTEFYIIEGGFSPCCYIKVAEWLGKIEHKALHGNGYGRIFCHGGVSFVNQYIPGIDDSGGFWVGWDYAHCFDHIANIQEGKKWTIAELLEEVTKVIDELPKEET